MSEEAESVPPSATLRWARRRYRQALKRDRLTATMWEDGAYVLINLTPPVSAVPVAKVPRVLVANMNWGIEPVEAAVPAAAERHGLKEYKVEHVAILGLSFWQCFFGTKDFLVQFNERSVPSLIVSSGNLRFYDSRGAGNCIYWPEFLKHVAEDWDIPLVLV